MASEMPSQGRKSSRGNASSSQGSSAGTDDGDAVSYSDHSPNDLTIVSGAALIMADCLGTGILALPADIHVLGLGVGLAFLVLNLPINLYAGTILSRSATWVEDRLGECSPVPADLDLEVTVTNNSGGGDDGDEDKLEAHANESTSLEQRQRRPKAGPSSTEQHPSEVHTTDFLGLTTALYHNPTSSPDNGKTRTLWPTRLVTTIYYVNIFLVLGNYILVMSHAVRSMLGEENICLPTAGIIASVLMYALAQLRTMANLGRSASVISLTALFIVVGICLASIEQGELGIDEGEDYEDNGEANEDLASSESTTTSPSISRQLAAIASIGFAVGSQKLLLNIRHEMAVKENASPKALGIALFIYGAVYVTVCVLAGDNPPSLLFDAINQGRIRKFAGFLLWVHVAVSYAINSQALTSSIDRVSFHRVSFCGLKHKDRTRWALLTFLISSSSYLVANAIPFFKDLVALIGALTSVPLTLLLPAILYRRVAGVPAFTLTSRHDLASYLLVIFSLVFLLCGLFGALDSIELDWSRHGPPFSCS
jgi:amino acid permease